MTEAKSPTPAHLVRSFYAAINARQWQVLDSVVDATFDPHIEHAGQGLAAFKRVLHLYLVGFSGFRSRVEQILIDGEYVTARVRTSGVHTGPFLGHAPSNRPFAVTAIEMFRIANSRIAERWSVFDTITMLIQLGLYTPATSGADSNTTTAQKTLPQQQSIRTMNSASTLPQVPPEPPRVKPERTAEPALLSFDNRLFAVTETSYGLVQP